MMHAQSKGILTTHVQFAVDLPQVCGKICRRPNDLLLVRLRQVSTANLRRIACVKSDFRLIHVAIAVNNTVWPRPMRDV